MAAFQIRIIFFNNIAVAGWIALKSLLHFIPCGDRATSEAQEKLQTGRLKNSSFFFSIRKARSSLIMSVILAREASFLRFLAVYTFRSHTEA